MSINYGMWLVTGVGGCLQGWGGCPHPFINIIVTNIYQNIFTMSINYGMWLVTGWLQGWGVDYRGWVGAPTPIST